MIRFHDIPRSLSTFICVIVLLREWFQQAVAMAADETIFPYNMGSSGGYPHYPHSFGSVPNVMNDPNSLGTFLF